MADVGSNLISLFCGPGGLDQGFKDAGFTTRLAYDRDQASIDTHRYNHPDATALLTDLSALDVASITEEWSRRAQGRPVGVIGGPPCQSFSISNVFQSETDARHELPEHYARLLKGLNDAFAIDFFVFENVPGLMSKRHKARFLKFKQLLDDAGFVVSDTVLDAYQFGVPQVRPRVFLVGLNRARYLGRKFEFPNGNGERQKRVEDVLLGLPTPTFFSRGLKPQDISFHPNHWCMCPKSRKFSNGTLRPGGDTGRSFRVLAWDRPSYTVAYGHREVHVHPSCTRRLSVLESMRLQGFDDQYVLKGTLSDQFRLVSEAVPPPVAKTIAEALNVQIGLGAKVA